VPDFRVADTAPEHPKLRAAGIAAAGIWSMAGAHCMNPAHLTDGWVPEHWVHAWAGGRRAAAKLVEVRLWTRSARGGIPGYQFHDWLSIQRSAAQIEDEKAAARERAKRSRERSERAAQRTANVRRTDTAAHPVDNSDPDTESGASRVTPAGRRARVHAREATTSHPVDNAAAEVSPAETSDGAGAGAPHVTRESHDSLSLTLTPSGSGGGETSSSERVARQNDPPAPNLDPTNPRCAEHRDIPATERGPNCRACRAVREQLEQQPGPRRDLEARGCPWCDADGWRIDPENRHRGALIPGVRCDHTPLVVAEAAS
jgi:hypothetical protein